MVYLATGLLCLMTVAFAGGRSGLVAVAVALAAFAYAFLVYRWWVPPAAAGAAVAAGYPLSRLLRRPRWLPLLAMAGAALAAFSVLGPADGLF